jgi:hypothetical protein
MRSASEVIFSTTFPLMFNSCPQTGQCQVIGAWRPRWSLDHREKIESVPHSTHFAERFKDVIVAMAILNFIFGVSILYQPMHQCCFLMPQSICRVAWPGIARPSHLDKHCCPN